MAEYKPRPATLLKMDAFLTAYEEEGVIQTACDIAGIPHQWVDSANARWRQSAEFESRFQRARRRHAAKVRKNLASIAKQNAAAAIALDKIYNKEDWRDDDPRLSIGTQNIIMMMPGTDLTKALPVGEGAIEAAFRPAPEAISVIQRFGLEQGRGQAEDEDAPRDRPDAGQSPSDLG